MPDYAALAFSVMADPTRRSILRLLSEEEELPVTGIAEHFPEMTRAAVSSHLRVLRSADMVSERRRGQFRFYSLGPNRADDVVQFLHSVYQRDLDAFVQRAEDGTT
ncbi:helix-turn-helix transcriptional regulator [Arthrobacter sp. CDRTa11]|uniref:ArsR/SmtB family transcription factor n=1 Tax=Arthrobacter sp. CDRTa11 TaxID=2651199 RepID=UPI002265E14C|nr:metalloregulator ArsR/SmtB family transcription factor [Arthrobacter sp. CDRTa11]UZX02888.1 helix-turn-helix transcriptional regulator [Arthrobacter sp. CDRTa11]